MALEFIPKKKSVNKEGRVAQAVVVRMNIGNIMNGIVLQRGCSSHQRSLGDARAEVLPRALQKGDLTLPFLSIKSPYVFSVDHIWFGVGISGVWELVHLLSHLGTFLVA